MDERLFRALGFVTDVAISFQGNVSVTGFLGIIADFCIVVNKLLFFNTMSVPILLPVNSSTGDSKSLPCNFAFCAYSFPLIS